MRYFKFSKEKMNFNNRWRVKVDEQVDNISSDAIVARMIYDYHYDRRALREMMDRLKEGVMEEMMDGNSVELFGIVRLSPVFELRTPCCGDEAYVSERMKKLLDKDVKVGVKALANLSMSRAFSMRYRKRMLRQGV